HPAGRAVPARDRRDGLNEDVVAVFEAAVPPRLHDAKKLRVAHLLDEIGGDLARRFGFEGALSRDGADPLGPAQQLGGGRNGAVPVDGGECHGEPPWFVARSLAPSSTARRRAANPA